MDELTSRHHRACDDFAAVADRVPDDRWSAPTPCTDWDARAVVEHVIGFHEFLLLRPLGIRAHRPREGPAARWRATSGALFAFLAEPGALDRETELPGGGHSSARTMLGALTTDVLVHTWDLARATGVDPALDEQLVSAAYAVVSRTDPDRAGGLLGPAVSVARDATVEAKLIAWHGRDPAWSPG